jgi:DNA-binding MarR family transcriptional regulator
MAPVRRPLPADLRPSRPPSGTDNFGNLFRDTTLAMQEMVRLRLVERGFGDLRPSMVAVAQHISADGSRVTDLAAAAWITKASVVQAIDELERRGYVERTPDPTDGRAKLVRMTAKGRAAEAAGREAIAEIRTALADAMGRARMRSLETGLRELRAVLWPDDVA